jgi:hypothetical protein
MAAKPLLRRRITFSFLFLSFSFSSWRCEGQISLSQKNKSPHSPPPLAKKNTGGFFINSRYPAARKAGYAERKKISALL